MLRLTLRSKLQIPLEAPCIVPDQLAIMSLAEIEKLPVQHGNRQEILAEYFTVAGDSADAAVEVAGDCSNVKWLGAKMTAGSLRVTGNTGMHCGSEMCGGTITIDGDADDWVGAEMRGGLIHVEGRGGHHVAASYPGSRIGMRGGIVLVKGSTGDGVANVMRRGLVAVGGCGDYAGSAMIAGSLFVFGAIGQFVGMGMRRGTIAAFGPKPTLLPTFRDSGAFRFPFLTIYMQKLRALGYTVSTAPGTFRRHCGDIVSLGLGEILVAE